MINLDHARELDRQDPLASWRDAFHFPLQKNGQPYLYFTGNSLGLQPKRTRAAVELELKDWELLGVEGHFHAHNPWMPYHEFLTDAMARVVGAKPIETVVMNTLTVNLHLMMVSFYRPSPQRYKILTEYSPFPSDRYAVLSQLAYHGYGPEGMIELQPSEGGTVVSMEQIEEVLEKEGESIALIMMGGVNYYTGQAYDIKRITALGHAKGCRVGFDLAHAAGNLRLQLHDDGPDFAVWCSYKYLNSGPGSCGGCFVHERHAHDAHLPRFAGWWGHDKKTRFLMGPDYRPIPGVEAWQLSNPPILSLAAIKASLEIFDEVGMEALRDKALKLAAYTEALLDALPTDRIELITPRDPAQRGCQLSIRVKGSDKSLFERISDAGVIADWREPDVIRIAPVPLYNSYADCWYFADALRAAL